LGSKRRYEIRRLIIPVPAILVSLKIGVNETALQAQIKAVGGRWDKDKKVWIVPYGCIRNTRMEKFIYVETAKTS
jgi:hypothetical protein